MFISGNKSIEKFRMVRVKEKPFFQGTLKYICCVINKFVICISKSIIYLNFNIGKMH